MRWPIWGSGTSNANGNYDSKSQEVNGESIKLETSRLNLQDYSEVQRGNSRNSESSHVPPLPPSSPSSTLFPSCISSSETSDSQNLPRSSTATGSVWARYASPDILLPSLAIASTFLGVRFVYVRYLRRIAETKGIGPSYWRKRSLLGVVTSVGDGDGFRLFHTPGGRLAGWGWLPGRRIPAGRGALKGKTISVRLAGVDAPEAAHFGHPGQRGAKEAHNWLDAYLRGRRVRAYVWRKDQYDRAVATAVRLTWAGLWRRDVGLLMLKRGLATVYEAKTGAEFGGLEEKYRKAESRAKWWRRGIWKLKDGETPREFKDRMKTEDNGHT